VCGVAERRKPAKKNKGGRPEKVRELLAEKRGVDAKGNALPTRLEAFYAALRTGAFLQHAVVLLGITKTSWDNWRERAAQGNKRYIGIVEKANHAIALAQLDASTLLHKMRTGKLAASEHHADFRALEFFLTHGPGKRNWFMRMPIELTVDDAKAKAAEDLLDVAKEFFSDPNERARFYEAVASKLGEEESGSDSEESES